MVFNFSKFNSFFVCNKYSTKLETIWIYQPTDVVQTFPLPSEIKSNSNQQLLVIADAYHEHRRQLMLSMQLWLTKTYNLFHSNAITA